VKEDGSFKLERVFDGDYFVEVSNLPDGYYIRSAKVGREDCTDEPLHVTGGVSGTLDIFVAKGMATLSGTVRDTEGNPAPRAMVMLVNEKTMKRMRSGRENASTEENGTFRFKDLAPGNYIVVAVDALEMEAGGATAFLNLDSILKSQGKPVRLDVTSNETIELKLAKLKE
jgi:uncharacterized surface anchored protein